MPRPDEGLIHAWLDGELEAGEAARVEKLVAEDAEWAAAAAEARGLIAASSRILGALDVVAGDVIPKGASAAPVLGTKPAPQVAPPQAPRRAVPTWMKMAAGLVLVAGIGYVGRDGLGFTEPDSTMMASRTTVIPNANDSAAGRVTALEVEPQPIAMAQVPEPTKAAERAAEPVARDADAPRRDAGAQEKRVRTVAPREIASSRGAGPPAPAPSTVSAPPPPTADAVAQVASTAAPLTAPANALANASAKSAQGASLAEMSRAGSASADSAQRARRAMSDLRLEGVVVTGMASSPTGAAPRTVMNGCWRAVTTARVDSMQTNPRITSTRGDTLTLALKPDGTTATVTRVGTEELRGQVRDTRGVTAPLSITRLVGCTP